MKGEEEGRREVVVVEEEEEEEEEESVKWKWKWKWWGVTFSNSVTLRLCDSATFWLHLLFLVSRLSRFLFFSSSHFILNCPKTKNDPPRRNLDCSTQSPGSPVHYCIPHPQRIRSSHRLALP